MSETPTKEPKPKKVTPVKKDYVYALGRRKTARARVRLYQDEKGEIEVNGKRIEEYFPGEANKSIYMEPLRTCNVIGRYRISIKSEGSGVTGQLGAIVHGISRCLDKVDEKYRPILKKRGFLTRDPRAKERRKVGTHGKARHKVQSPRR